MNAMRRRGVAMASYKNCVGEKETHHRWNPETKYN
jgi:hypothetical protein